MLKKIKNIYYKELFLYGFYITYQTLISLASIVDLYVENYTDFFIEFGSVLVISLIFIYYKKNKNLELVSAILFWIASGSVLLLVIQNHFNISIIFTVLTPLMAFILLSPSGVVLHVSIYLVALFSTFWYGYTLYETHPLLYNMSYMNTYIISIFFVLAFGFIYHIAIEQSFHTLEKSNRQKTFLLKEIHHRVKNNLNIISSILGIQKLESETFEVHKLIDQNRLRLESMAMAHEILYQCDSFINIDFEIYINKLSKHILFIESHGQEIQLVFHSVPLSLSIEKMIQFGMMINELITNSLKYAFPQDGGKIFISLLKNEKGYIFIYRDDGDGCNFEEVEKGFGYALIGMAVEQLDGILEIDNKEGLQYKIVLERLHNENIDC